MLLLQHCQLSVPEEACVAQDNCTCQLSMHTGDCAQAHMALSGLCCLDSQKKRKRKSRLLSVMLRACVPRMLGWTWVQRLQLWRQRRSLFICFLCFSFLSLSFICTRKQFWAGIAVLGFILDMQLLVLRVTNFWPSLTQESSVRHRLYVRMSYAYQAHMWVRIACLVCAP